MEVETWPPLVDGKLGLRGRGSSPDLNLAVSDDILSDEERELLQSPVRDENQTTCVEDALVNSSKHESEQEKIPIETSVSAKCNGEIGSETVSDAALVFRTEKDCGAVLATKLSDKISKLHSGEDDGGTTGATAGGENGLCGDSDIKEDKIGRKSSSDPCDDVSGTDVIVEDPCSLDAAELHVSDDQKLVETCTEDRNLEANDELGLAPTEDSSNIVSSADNIISNEGNDEDHLLDSGLSPKSLKDFGDELDDMEIPQVIDISSICINKETEDAQTTLEAAREVCGLGETVVDGKEEEIAATGEVPETVGPDGDGKSETVPVGVSIASPKDISPSLAEDNGLSASIVGEETENTAPGVEEDTPASGEDIENVAEEEENKIVEEPVEEVPAVGEDNITSCRVNDSDALAMPSAEESNEAISPEEDTLVDDSMDFDQEDGSPDYQGMTDDILPIIESELDDMPVGEGNIFDTEVECDDGTCMQEETEDSNEEASSNLPADIEDDSASSPRASEVCQTEDKEQEECSTKKDFDSHFSLSDRVKLKRRGSADNAGSPPTKVLKRMSSLDNLNECGERFDTLKSFDEFKKLSTKKLPVAQENIASEPLDIPIDIEDNQAESAPILPKRRKTTDVALEVEASSSRTESVVQPAEKPKDKSVLVIDLDDDDDKPCTVERPPSESKSSTNEQAEPSNNEPRCALDILFNGKKEITLNRKMFARVMKSYVSQYLLTFGEFGKAASLSLKANEVLNKIQSNVASYEKQKEDFKSIMTKLIEDRQARKTWDENLVPPRATRSVGLQVCSVGSMYVKNGPGVDDASTSNRNTAKAKASSSSNNQSQALAQQKQAFAQQQMVMAQSRMKQAEQQMNNIRPIAKKSVTPTNRPVPIKSVPVSKPVTPIKPKPSAPQFSVTAPKLNGLKAVTVTRNPEPTSAPQTTPLTVTTASPNSRTFTLSNKGTFALKSPQKATSVDSSQFKQSNSMLSKALMTGGVASRPTSVTPKPASQNASKAVPVAVSHTPGTVQNSKNLASGPGRPGKSPAPGKKPGPTVPDTTTIDLTDDDVPPPSKPSVATKENSTARKSTAPSRVGVQAKVPVVGKQMRHPALPPNPPNFNPSTAPPRPYLGICDTQTVTQGIMLTWHFNNVIPLRKISKFQVFAYQESKGDGEDAWKKVGDVDALPLPMACTLTQFREGYTYHFIVRALDDIGHVGPFSAPNTITLMKKTV